MSKPPIRSRRWTILAQDPSFRTASGGPLLATVRVPAEALLPGPRGHRVQVIDFDPATNTLYRPLERGLDEDPYAGREIFTVEELIDDPHFHAQNTYAISMATLGHFERALGRRVHWSFASRSAQITIAPHGIAEPNAFYSRRDEALVFGYFPAARKPGTTIFTCLSHDIVAHETSHALLDGLRPQYIRPSSSDQIAFHEGFSDLVAILSVFNLQEVVRHVLDPQDRRPRTIAATGVSVEALQHSALLALAEEMGSELTASRGNALRESALLEPAVDILDKEEFQSPHRRGELLVAPMLRAFLEVWTKRLYKFADTDDSRPHRINLDRAVEEGAKAAGQLLGIALRALDYTPPVDIHFGDFLSAMLTADAEACPDDSRYGYRDVLRDWFARFGIHPAASGGAEPGLWQGPDGPFEYRRIHAAELRSDRVAAFRFLWENQRALEIDADARTVVDALHTITKLAPDGFVLHETVMEYRQSLDLRARELKRFGIAAPAGMAADRMLTLCGGGTLIFNEHGNLKYHIGTGVSSARQGAKLSHLWQLGYFDAAPLPARRFALLHRARAWGSREQRREAW